MTAFKDNDIVGGQKHLCSRVRKRLAMDIGSIPSSAPSASDLTVCFPKRRKLGDLSKFVEVLSVSSPDVLSVSSPNLAPTQPAAWQHGSSSLLSPPQQEVKRRSLRLAQRAQQQQQQVQSHSSA